MAFVHLHTHSQFSILDGTATVKALAKAAAKRGQAALALTDSANLYGAVAFYKACKAEGIRSVLGAELHVQPEGVQYADPLGIDGGYQLIALVENAQGYQNLSALITSGIFEGMHFKPRVDLELLQAHAEGLIFLTAGLKGPLGKALVRDDLPLATERLSALTAFLDPEHLYLELQDLGLPNQEEVNEHVRGLARATGYSTVVTNAVHYLDPEDSAVLEVLNTISTGGSLAADHPVNSPTDQAWLKTEAEMVELFPQDLDAIERTGTIAARCSYDFDFNTYHFPASVPPDPAKDADTDANWAYFYTAFPPPRSYGLPSPNEAIPPRPEGAGNIDGYFAWYAETGLKLRLERVSDEHEPYRTQIAYEIGVINQMGFPAYMLIVAEFINWSKENAIPVGPGRGSAAGSVVAWAMSITDIDPIRFGLVFERFLNPQRISMPDIDVDFCQDRREEAIEHVRQKYGTELVSQIITYGTLKAKAAVKDVGRVMGLSFRESDRLSKLIPEKLGSTIQDALDEVELMRRIRDGDPKIRRVLDVAQAVEGTMRQTGVHAAGVVIADRPLVEYAPMYREGPDGGPVVQYDMKSAESIGLIKFDFLGLKTLDQIRDALVLIKENHGVDVDMAALPVDDAATYTMLQAGDALGVFQLESRGMRELLARLRPSVIDDMVALVALYRPGPLQSGMTDDFVERKHGRREVSYPLPMLEETLQGTYGTIIYQEQVMQIAQIMAGYSLGEADLLRRAMGKKDAVEMDKQRERFVSGSIANEVHADKANEIFDLMAKFAAYGFNKAHSAAYGWISYQTAYLKAHYRPEFMAALMTVESGDKDKVRAYIADCRRAGIQVEPPCVNRSMVHFSVPAPADRPVVEDERIGVVRYGMIAVKNVGRPSVEAIVEAREAVGGSFRNAMDFFEKLDLTRVNKRVLENLIRAGALDCFGVARAAMIQGLPSAVSTAQRRQDDKAAGQASLFSMLAPTERPKDFRFPDRLEWPISERLAHEHDVLGLYLSAHPMEAHKTDVERYSNATIEGLDGRRRDEVRLLGIIAESRVTRTRSGDKMAFVKLEEPNAMIECVFGPDSWASSQRAVLAGGAVRVTGTVEIRNDELRIRASSAEPLSEVRARMTAEVRLEVKIEELTPKRLAQLNEVFKNCGGGCRTLVVMTGPKWTAEIRPEASVEPSVRMEEGVNQVFGRRVVVLT